MKMLLCLLVVLAFASMAAAQAPKRCITCSGPIGASYFNYNSPTRGDKQPVCETCHTLKGRCATCKLPVPATSRRLDDGRVFCEADLRSGVFDQNEARRVFEEARRDAAGFLGSYGALPDRNITVALVGGLELKKTIQTLPSEHGADGTLGVTRTESFARKQFTHQISLINGLSRNRLAAVCAHEYTHAWLAENLAPDRKLEKDTVEGFCELIAYKVMVKRRDEPQKKIILENAYTRGQVNAFVEAEQQHHFHRIVRWVQIGVDETLFQTNKVRLLALRSDDESAAPDWPPPKPLLTAVPDTLTLKGISGGPARRFALINNATLMKHEEVKIRVGTSNVVVRCLDIRPGSVLIQIKGAAQPKELFLANSE